MKNSKKITVFFLALLLVLSIGFSGIVFSADEHKGTAAAAMNSDKISYVKVNANKKTGKIDRKIYGVHVPAWNETIYERGVIKPEFKRNISNLNPGFLVYPGGNYGYHFVWNDLNLPTEMNTDQFLQLTKDLNASAKISLNPDESPQLAADWVDYINNQKKAGVKYWEIADEPYLTMKKEEFIQKMKEFVPVLKKVDPDIKIIANVSASDPDFTKTVIKETGHLIDVYSIHSLPLPPSKKFNSNSPYTEDNKQAFYEDLLHKTPTAIRKEIRQVKSWVKEYRGNQAVEYHIGSFSPVWAYPEDWTVNALPAGLWTADVLGIFAEEGIDAAAYWALMNPYPPGQGDYGLLSPEMKPYVNYYAFELFGRHFGDTLVANQLEGDSGLSVYTSTGEDGKNLYIIAINKSPDQDRKVEFDLLNFKPRGDAAAWILDGPAVPDHVYDYGLRKESLKAGKNGKFSWTIPSYSAVAIKIPGKESDLSLKETPNLAVNKTASASSSAFDTDMKYTRTSDFTPDHAIDGDKQTRWASRIFQQDKEYLQIDLGQVHKFNQMKIDWEYWADQYEIWVSNDQKTWKKVADQSALQREKEKPQPRDAFYFDAPIKARFVKISMHKRPGQTGAAAGTSQWTPGAFSIWELGIYLK
ncbi:MAG: discoidin domain-containing protein [Thermoactinomyces sp.]